LQLGSDLRGASVARLLAGSWRLEPGPLSVSAEDLEEVAPLVLASGAGALLWRRLGSTPLADTSTAEDLHEAYRLHAIRAAVHDAEVAAVFRRLADHGVTAVLVKGWAAARLYAQPGLRPYGDVDLLVATSDLRALREALAGASPAATTDLHPGGGWLSDRRWHDVVARSRLHRLGDVEVRVAGPEDHLRYLCLHFLGHGGWRPLWLCDVAAALESLPAAFEWGYFLDGDRRRAEWTTHAVALAVTLLGASMAGEEAHRAPPTPAWLPRTVLREWGRPQVPHGTRTPMAAVLRHPSRLPRALWQRWPNAIEATVDVGGRFDASPRIPYQLAECAARTARFVRQYVRPNPNG
jgi:hypothetical protein